MWKDLKKIPDYIYEFVGRKYKVRFEDYIKEVFENNLKIPFEEWRNIILKEKGFFEN